MREIERTILFKSQKLPISAIWKIDDVQALGTLSWNKHGPILTLYFEAEEENEADFEDADLPLLNKTKPPLRARFSGQVQRFGSITLDECVRYNVRTTSGARAGKCIYELDFLPRTIWIGHRKDDVDNKITRFMASDRRISGFFGSPGLKVINRSHHQYEEIYEILQCPDSIWTLHGPDHSRILLGDTGWKINITTNVVSSTSSTNGHSTESSVCITAFSPKPSSIEDASKIVMQIENLLSTFSIEPFSFESEIYQTDEFENISAVWRLGVDENQFQAPMRHQILINLADPDTLRNACQKWFSATKAERLSRWLFVRAIQETDSGLARFVAVSQAFEVLGRELGKSRRMSKSNLKDATNRIKNALEGDFDADFIERTLKLIQSSNRLSFRDMLYQILSQPAQDLDLGKDSELKDFCKEISDLRNVIVHMANDDENNLNAAFSKVNKMSLKMCFWFSVVQAHQMGLEVPDIRTFLFNNRNARHGLPNEVLERL